MSAVVGIDPGLKGAIAAIEGRRIVFLQDCPTMLVEVGKVMRRAYCESEMVAALAKLAGARGIDLVGIERQQAFPGRPDASGRMQSQGVVSTFSTGLGFGLWCGIIAALGLRNVRPTPSAWKRAMLAGLAPGKGSSVLAASRLFPEAPLRGPRGAFLDGRAEALLIAEYCRQRAARALWLP
jgi:hypothetical protein